MSTSQERNRAKLYTTLKQTTIKKGSGWFAKEGVPVLDENMGYPEFISTYFSSQERFEKMWGDFTNVMTDKGLVVNPSTQPLEFFYSKFACDLEWAAEVPTCAEAARKEQLLQSFPDCVKPAGEFKISPTNIPYIEGTGQYAGKRFFLQGKMQNVRTNTNGTYSCNGENIVINDGTPAQQTQPADSTAQQQAQPQAQPQQQAQPQAQTGRPPLQFRKCQGTYTPGCVNTDAIAQVQRCLDLTSPKYPRGSGYFDYDLQDKLSSMGYKNGFTDADIAKICEMDAKKTKPFQAQENDVPGVSNETPRQTYEKYYAKFDGKETDRVKLKVNNLPDSDLKNLNKYFLTQGLYKIKNPKRRYGTKFVWGKKPS